MPEVRVRITRYVQEDPFPGLVECALKDVHGAVWLFVEKVAVVSTEDLTRASRYPRDGTIRCRIDHLSPDTGFVRIDTRTPDGVEAVPDQEHRFEVRREQVIGPVTS